MMMLWYSRYKFVQSCEGGVAVFADVDVAAVQVLNEQAGHS